MTKLILRVFDAYDRGIGTHTNKFIVVVFCPTGKMPGFIIFPSTMFDLLQSYFVPVPGDDPIRQILQDIPTPEKAISSILEEHFEDYGFFIHTENPVNGRINHETNLFFERSRDFTVSKGVYAGVRLRPVMPIRVYKRVRSIKEECMPEQRLWMVESILPRILSERSATLCLMAGDETRHIMISPFIKQQLCVREEDGCIPLLVLTTPGHSLDFAGIVVDLLHCCSRDEMVSIVRGNQLSGILSVDRKRKMYDIFPEEYITIPRHVWNFLRSIDHYELSGEDVQELREYYSSC